MRSFIEYVKCNLSTVIVILIGVLMLSVLQILNGFPLVMTDSIGYLQRANSFSETSHWSNTYTAFLSLIIKTLHSVQWVSIIQNLLVVIVLYIFSKAYIRQFNYLIFLIILLTLSFTTLPWMSTMVMSDIFTPLTLLAILLIVDKKISRLETISLIGLLFIGISAHQSHLIIIPLFTIAYICFSYIARKDLTKLNIFKSLALITILFISSNIFEKNIFNKKIDGKKIGENVSNPDISSGYYFIAVRIAESGELKYMLDKFCDEGRSGYFCNGSKVYDASRLKTGRGQTRNPTNKAYVNYSIDNKKLAFFALTKPRFYLGITRLIVKRGFSALNTTKLRTFKRPNHTQMQRFHSIFGKINQQDVLSFEKSKQAKNIISSFVLNNYFKINRIWWLIVLPVVLMLTLFLKLKKANRFSVEHKGLYFFLIFGHILNTIICATFSNSGNVRYSNRTIWLMNLVIVLLSIQIIQYLARRKKEVQA